MDHWTERVTARRQLAKLIKDGHLERAKAAGLTERDLDVLISSGEDAERWDTEQKQQLAHLEATFAGRKVVGDELFARGQQLRSRLPAVIGDLRAAGDQHAATFLERLSFARFRFREMSGTAEGGASTAGSATSGATAGGTTAATTGTGATSSTAPSSEIAELSPAQQEAVRTVRRVPREDRPGRATGLANLCDVLSREPAVMSHLAARSLTPEWLAQLRGDARAYGEAGRNVRLAAEATDKETQAAKLQREKWQVVRRMIRVLVQGSPELASKYAEC